MNKFLITLYGGVCYLGFVLTFLYLPIFLLELEGVKSINSGLEGPLTKAVSTNLALVMLFGVTHSVMARDWFKRWLTCYVSPAAERSTYVLQASAFLLLAMVLWQPMSQVIWALNGWAMLAAYAFFAIGLVVVLWSTFLIDHFELFGLRQVWRHQTGQAMPESSFRTPSLYRLVRHPMQLGVVIVLFATPQMTAGHLLFAVAMTAYILIGLMFEERALVRAFGARYRAYQKCVPMLVPRLWPMARVFASRADADGRYDARL